MALVQPLVAWYCIYMTKYCEHCGEEFESSEYEDTYCSWDCQSARVDEDADNDFETAFYGPADEEESAA